MKEDERLCCSDRAVVCKYAFDADPCLHLDIQLGCLKQRGILAASLALKRVDAVQILPHNFLVQRQRLVIGCTNKDLCIKRLPDTPTLFYITLASASVIQ